MSLSRSFLIILSRLVTGAMFRVHTEELARVPERGPLILVVNHVTFWEIPLLYVHLQPRPVRGLVLDTRWRNPFFAWALNASGSLPLQRGGTNLDSFRGALQALSAGEILIIMPEGTRSHDGRLGQGHPGVVLLAQRSGARLLPVVTYGGEQYPRNLKRLRRTDFYIRAGEPFTLPGAEVRDSQARKQILNEIMRRMAALLPKEYRGMYE